MTLANYSLTSAMIAVIQRVRSASVGINGILKSKIGNGLLILIGIEDADNERILSGCLPRLSTSGSSTTSRV